MEEQVVQNVEEEKTLDLEEDAIPSENKDSSDNALNDVVPCDYVTIDSQPVAETTMDSSGDDGLYGGESGYTPNTDIDQMVDISKMVEVVPGGNSEYELEEVNIPNEENTPDDDQLDDVVVQ